MHHPRSIRAARRLRIASLLLLGSRLVIPAAGGMLLYSMFANEHPRMREHAKRTIQSMKTNPILTSLLFSAFLSGGIALTSGCKSAPVERTATERSDDEGVSEAVKAALANSASFKFPDVRATSFKGKVQLSGFVISEEAKSSAETITKEVAGVVSVENKISLKK